MTFNTNQALLIAKVAGMVKRPMTYAEVTDFLTAVEDCFPQPAPVANRPIVSLKPLWSALEGCFNNWSGHEYGKIAAIKAYREVTGQGLLESKNAIEALMEWKSLIRS